MRFQERLWCVFQPDEGGGAAGGSVGGGQTAAAAPAAGSAGTNTATAAPQTTSGAGLSTSATTAQAQAGGQAGFLGVREALKGYGVDLSSQFDNDHAALQYLALAHQQARQNGQLAQYGQLYLQHADQFNAWLRQQQQAAQQQQQGQQQSWWKAPEYDPTWASKLTRDPTTGQITALPGADPSLVNKYLAALDHRQTFLDKFAFDPMGSIKPGIEEIARAVAQQVMQQSLGGYQDQTFAQGWVGQNSQWLHARDQQGNVLRNHLGQPQLSQWGQRFAQYVQQADSMGIPNVQAQRDYALALTRQDYLMAQNQQAQGQQVQTQGDAGKQQFLAAAQQQHAANQGNLAANGSQPRGPTMRTQRDLQAALMGAMQQNGFQPGQTLIGQ